MKSTYRPSTGASVRADMLDIDLTPDDITPSDATPVHITPTMMRKNLTSEFNAQDPDVVLTSQPKKKHLITVGVASDRSLLSLRDEANLSSRPSSAVSRTSTTTGLGLADDQKSVSTLHSVPSIDNC